MKLTEMDYQEKRIEVTPLALWEARAKCRQGQGTFPDATLTQSVSVPGERGLRSERARLCQSKRAP